MINNRRIKLYWNTWIGLRFQIFVDQCNFFKQISFLKLPKPVGCSLSRFFIFVFFKIIQLLLLFDLRRFQLPRPMHQNNSKIIQCVFQSRAVTFQPGNAVQKIDLHFFKFYFILRSIWQNSHHIIFRYFCQI